MNRRQISAKIENPQQNSFYKGIEIQKTIQESGYDKTFHGLSNPKNTNNCFLNVVIQSLWHLASFRDNFLMSYQVFQNNDEQFEMSQSKKSNKNRIDESIEGQMKFQHQNHQYQTIQEVLGQLFSEERVIQKEINSIRKSNNQNQIQQSQSSVQTRSQKKDDGYSFTFNNLLCSGVDDKSNMDQQEFSFNQSNSEDKFQQNSTFNQSRVKDYDDQLGNQWDRDSEYCSKRQKLNDNEERQFQQFGQYKDINMNKEQESYISQIKDYRQNQFQEYSVEEQILQKQIQDDINTNQKNIIQNQMQPKMMEICLFCNLLKLFRKYQHQDLIVQNVKDTVLEPKDVRMCLESMMQKESSLIAQIEKKRNQIQTNQQLQSYQISQSQSIIPQTMGCAQETFESILRCIHRDSVHQRGFYIEEFMHLGGNERFQLDNKLDEEGCSSTCASHLTFGIELCDIIQCFECQYFDRIKQTYSPSFIHQIYTAEVLSILQNNTYCKQLSQIMQIIINQENQTLFQRYKKNQETPGGDYEQQNEDEFINFCANCQQHETLQLEKYILKTPNVYTIGIQWLQNIEIANDKYGRFQDETDKKDILTILELITSEIDLNDFYKTQQNNNYQQTPTGIELIQKQQEYSKISQSQSNSFINAKYILRGMIVFYGRHYMAYFYSEKHDGWYLFDDENIKKIGNWSSVKQHCTNGRAQPIILFYEKQEIIVNFLTQGNQLQNLPGYQNIMKQLKHMNSNINKKQKIFTPGEDTPNGEFISLNQAHHLNNSNGKPLVNPQFNRMMQELYLNVVKNPDNFYFTEQGKLLTNFWEGQSNEQFVQQTQNTCDIF